MKQASSLSREVLLSSSEEQAFMDKTHRVYGRVPSCMQLINGVRLASIANQNIKHLVTFELQINNKQIFSRKTSRICVRKEHIYSKTIVYLKHKHNIVLGVLGRQP